MADTEEDMEEAEAEVVMAHHHLLDMVVAPEDFKLHPHKVLPLVLIHSKSLLLVASRHRIHR